MHNRMSEQLNTQEQSAYSPKPISEEKRITNIYIYIVDGIWVLLTARYLRNNTKRTQQNQCLAAHGPVFSDSFFLSHFVWFWISDYISHSRTLYANGVRSMKKQNGKKKLQLVHKFKGVELFFFFFFLSQLKRQLSSDMCSCAVHILIPCEVRTATELQSGSGEYHMHISFHFNRMSIHRVHLIRPLRIHAEMVPSSTFRWPLDRTQKNVIKSDNEDRLHLQIKR